MMAGHRGRLRQAEAFSRTVLALLGLALAVPDHTTLSRRAGAFAGRQLRVAQHDGSVHLVLDSTGLQLFGQGEWDAQKHGRTRRHWRKPPIAVDADGGGIAGHGLTRDNTDDAAARAPDFLRTVEGSVVNVTASGACDGNAVHRAAIWQQGPPPDVVIPPRPCAVPSTDDPAARTPRDRPIRLVAEQGRMAQQRAGGYGRRTHVQTAIGRYKHLIGPKLRARALPGQQCEATLAVTVLNHTIRTAKPVPMRKT